MTKGDATRCPRRAAAMEEGYIVDRVGSGTEHYPARWAKGRPQEVFGETMPSSGLDPRPIVTYRCPEYGRLESFVR